MTTATATNNKRGPGRPKKLRTSVPAQPGSLEQTCEAVLDMLIHIIETNDRVLIRNEELKRNLYRQKEAIEAARG